MISEHEQRIARKNVAILQAELARLAENTAALRTLPKPPSSQGGPVSLMNNEWALRTEHGANYPWGDN